MISATSFQTVHIGHSDIYSVQQRDPWDAPNPRACDQAMRDLEREPQAWGLLRANALKAAVTLLASENRSLQETLEAERRFCADLRTALERQCQEARTDPLTGLYNRRAMDQELNRFLAEQGNTPLSVMMLDVDHFKHINDTYGHPRGDQVLRQIAETLGRCLRCEDSAFRYGGEEFMVLLPNTSLDGAIRVAEDIRRRIERLRLDDEQHASATAPCTVSLGVASRKQDDDPGSLCLRADQAMYLAKHLGRNQVVDESALRGSA